MTSKPNGKQIAEDRDGTDGSVDQEVQAHPCNHDLRHLKPRGQYQDRGPDEINQHVTDSWNQPKQRIEPQIDPCAGNSDGRIQNLGQ